MHRGSIAVNRISKVHSIEEIGFLVYKNREDNRNFKIQLLAFPGLE